MAGLAASLSLAAHPVRAVDLGAQPLEVRAWDRTDGLHAVAQGPDGMLWMGSRTGLARFDGGRFVPVDVGQQTPRSGTWVRRILAASDGSLLVAHGAGDLVWETSARPQLVARHGGDGAGLLRLEPYHPLREGARLQRFTGDGGLPSEWVWALAEDRSGDVWIGTEVGLARLRGGRIAPVATGAPPGPVAALAVAPDGALYAGTPAGVMVRPHGGGAFTATAIAEPVLALAVDRARRLWALGHRRLLRLDASGRMTSFPAPVATALAVDTDDNLWVGSDGAILQVFSGGEPARLDWHGPPNDVTNLLADREGSVWIARRNGSLVQVASPPVRTLEMPGSVATFALLRTRGDGMYVATDRGVGRYREGVWTLWPRVVESGPGPRDLAEGPPGSAAAGVWVCDVHGVWRQQGTRFVRLELPGTPPSPGCRNLLVTRTGDLWVGWRGQGLHRFDQADLARPPLVLPVEAGLCTTELTSGLEARDGSLWFAEAYDQRRPAGVTRIEGGRARCYGAADGLPRVHIGAVAEDRAGSLWLGTGWGAGLVRFRDGRFTVVPAELGLPRANITGIVDDGRGHLFIGTENGIWRVPRHELDACAEGRCAKLSAVAYGQADGMRTPECTGAFQPNMALDERGHVWTATLRGVSVISPPGLHPSPAARPAPRPVIEELAIDGVAVGVGSEVRLLPGQRDLVVRYTAPSLVGARPRLAHRLTGFDSDWVPASWPAVAHYQNLPPGRYGFEIRAGTTLHQLPVVVEPPLWRQPSTLFGAAGFTGAVVAFGWRVRRGRRLAKELAAREERTRIARELHDGLAQKLAAMGLLADRARLGDGRTPAGSELTQLRHILDETHAELRRAIWDLRYQDLQGRPTAQRLEPLIERVLAELIVPAGLELRLDTAEQSLPVGGLIAHEAPLVAKEAVSNALRHAQASVIEIGVISDEDGVNLWVRDDGRGLPDLQSAARGAGCGLVGMYERARRVGGQLAIRRLARGTEVRLAVPRSRAAGPAGGA